MSNSSKLIQIANQLKTASNAEVSLQKLIVHIVKDQIFQNKLFISGGYVRDFVKGILSNDLDLVVQLNGGSKLFCQYLIELFDGYVIYQMLNPSYPTYNIRFKQNVVYDGCEYNVKNASLDISDTSLKRFPEDSDKQKLFIYGTLYQDAMQRDFTINSLFKNICTGQLIDFTGYGINDIKNNLLRTIPGRNKHRLFYDNPKIMMRFCRFFAKYKMNFCKEDVEYIRINAQRLLTLTQQSIRKQLAKVSDDFKQQYYKMAKYVGIYDYLIKYSTDKA